MLGILGGMSWQSTAAYYRLINEGVQRARGGHHSAPLLVASVDFAPVEAWQRSGEWERAAAFLADAGRALERGGAFAIAMTTNTMHRVFSTLESATTIPWIHIADATADSIAAASLRRVALLGTRFTMEESFLRDRIAERAGVEVIVPDAEGRSAVDAIIFGELVHGIVRDESRSRYREIVGRLQRDGADGVILGCTEIGLLIGAGDVDVPVFDTTATHAAACVEALLAR